MRLLLFIFTIFCTTTQAAEESKDDDEFAPAKRPVIILGEKIEIEEGNPFNLITEPSRDISAYTAAVISTDPIEIITITVPEGETPESAALKSGFSVAPVLKGILGAKVYTIKGIDVYIFHDSNLLKALSDCDLI